MSFPFKIVLRTPRPCAPKSHKGPLKAAWSRDPKSGRLSQSWRSSDDGERSCIRRPARPPSHRTLPLARAA